MEELNIENLKKDLGFKAFLNSQDLTIENFTNDEDSIKQLQDLWGEYQTKDKNSQSNINPDTNLDASIKQSAPQQLKAPSSTPITQTPVQENDQKIRTDRLRALATGKGLPSSATTLEGYKSRVEELLGDGKFSRGDFKEMAGLLGLNKYQAKAFRKTVKQGGDTSAYMNNLQRKYYVKNGKMYEEDQDGFDSNEYDQIIATGKGYAGTDATDVTNRYNAAVNDWRQKKGNITYDATTGKYYAEGFDDGFNSAKTRVDVTNSEWAKDKNEAARKTWFDNNKNKLTYDNGSVMFNGTAIKDSSWMDQDFVNRLSAEDFKRDVDHYKPTDPKEAFDAVYGKRGNWNLMNTKLGFTDPKSLKDPDYEEKYRQALDDHLKQYTLDKGAIAGTALYNYLKDQGLLHVNKGKDVELASDHPWSQAQQILSPINEETKKYAFMKHENGGNLNTKKIRTACKKGEIISKAQLGAILSKKFGNNNKYINFAGKALDFGLDFVPIAGAVNRTVGHWINGEDADWLGAGLNLLGPAAKIAKTAYSGYKAYKTGNAAFKTLSTAEKAFNQAKNAKNAAAKMFSKEYNAVQKAEQALQKGTGTKRDLDLARQALNNKLKANPATAKYVDNLNTARTAVNDAKTATNGITRLGEGQNWWQKTKTGWKLGKIENPGNTFLTFGPKGFKWKTGITATQLLGQAREAEFPEESNLQNPTISQQLTIPQQSTVIQQPLVETSNFKATGNNWYYKQGGNLNMNNINYFQEGGAMAPQAAPAAAPAQGGQDIQAQVMQLVQAAMSGDEQATQTIQQIMQAAQQGDQQAAQIAQLIQQIAQQMQGQATAAKYGAKLSYIRSLRSGCPEGTEAKFFKKGGRVCKECIKKGQEGASVKETPKVPEASCGKKMKACGGAKATKHAEGGNLENLRAMFATYKG